MPRASALLRSAGEASQDGELTDSETTSLTEEGPPEARPAATGRGVVLLLVGAAGAACWAGGRRLAPSARAAGAREQHFGLSRAANRTTLLVARQCSDDRESCLETRCCNGADVHCFQKDSFWAQCRSSCHNGTVDLRDLKDPWTCNRLDAREQEAAEEAASSCAAPGMNCMDNKCCRDSGQGCFRKDDSWASCRDTCERGKHDPLGPDRAPWSCEALSPRREAKRGARSEKTKTREQKKQAANATGGLDMVDAQHSLDEYLSALHCSFAGHDCSGTRCCQDKGLRCFEKNRSYSGCRQSCQPGLVDVGGDLWTCGVHSGSDDSAPQSRRLPRQSSHVSESATPSAIGSTLAPQVSAHTVSNDAPGVFDAALDAFVEEIEEMDRKLEVEIASEVPRG